MTTTNRYLIKSKYKIDQELDKNEKKCVFLVEDMSENNEK
jgi:hypothetical protein